MLGQFLEVSITVDAPAESLAFYRSLGFEELGVIEVLAEPYAAVWDGRVAVGMHARRFEGPALTFVRPDLKSYLRAFRHAGVEIEFMHLSEDEFHQAGLVDPNGQLVVLNEARTYSPALWQRSAVPACGELVEYSVPTVSLEKSADFWQRLGLDVVAEGAHPHRWMRLDGNGLVLGLHEAPPFDAGLTFRANNFEARCAYLRALGQQLSTRAPVAVDTRSAATLATPDPLAIYLVGEATS